jgi:hypothetical protein
MIHGIRYDTERDENASAGGNDGRFSRATASGAFYLHDRVRQILDGGEWRNRRPHEDFCATLGIVFPEDLPDPRIRALDTARAEALRWYIDNIAPENDRRDFTAAVDLAEGHRE